MKEPTRRAHRFCRYCVNEMESTQMRFSDSNEEEIHSINRSGKRVENNKMNLDTLIDFNCIVLHFMEISRWRQSSTVIVG